MPESLSLVIVHVIFSTKNRHPFLDAESRSSMHAYLATIARDLECECYRAGGVKDHVHLAIRLSRTITIAHLIERLKTLSSQWAKKEFPALKQFAWQRGYGCFSVNPRDLDALRNYIDTPKRNTTKREHSRKSSGCGWKNMRSNIMRRMCGIEVDESRRRHSGNLRLVSWGLRPRLG